MMIERIVDWFKAGRKRGLVLLPVLGVLFLVVMVKLKSPPEKNSAATQVPPVKVGLVQQRELQHQVVGYGRAQAKQTWRAISEVEGRVIYKHPDLEVGAMLPAGTVMLKIDPVDYELKLAQAKYDLNSAQAQADMIKFNQKKTTQSLALESQRLKILEQELKRKVGLLGKGSVSQSAVDQQRSQVFAQQQKVLELQTNVNLIPSDLEVAQARVQVQYARVQEAQRQLDKTTIVLPQDSRITAVNVENEQVITMRSTLFEARHLGDMKVDAQFNLTQARALLRQVWVSQDIHDQGLPDVRRLPLNATLRHYTSDTLEQPALTWPAKVTRVLQNTQASSNSLQMVLETHNKWQGFNPVVQPPLLGDMFVEVTVRSPAKAYLSVPQNALKDGYVFIVRDSKLVKKPVSVLFSGDGYVALDSGLANTVSEGDWVLVTELMPALEGMSVQVIEGNE